MVASPLQPSEPISNAAKRGGPRLAVFGSIFAIIGFALLIPLFLLPMFHVIEAQGWRSVPCTVLHSEIISHSSSKGTTYSIKISFKYTFDNVQYVGTRYDFSIGSSSGLDYRRAIVHRLHAGARTVCYVNSTDPSDSVIDRGPPRELWFGLIPLAFVIVGAWIVIFAVRNAHPKPASFSEVGSGGAISRNPTQLKEAQSPLAKLVGIGLFTLFWNGIVSVFLRQAYFVSSGSTDWFLRIFLIPFILIGLLTIVAWFHQLLAIFNPRPHLTLTNPAIALGESSELRWTFTGNVSRISRLTIRIEGRESATYQRHSSSKNGNSSVTDTSTFAQLPIADTPRKMEIASGRATFTVTACIRSHRAITRSSGRSSSTAKSPAGRT